jgi:hypothetical protein
VSDVLCAVCAKPVGDNAYICQEDTIRLEQSLSDVGWIDHELDVVLMRQTATGERVGGASVEKPLPYDPRATEARWVLTNTITTWARVIEEEHAPDAAYLGPVHGICAHRSCIQIRGVHAPQASLGITAVWIGSWSGWLRHHLAAEEIWGELGSAIADAKRLVDTRPQRFYAGPCAGFEDTPCSQDLYANVGKADITCPACGAKYDATARREWLVEASRDHLATAREVVALLKAMLGDLISVDMIRGYVRRGKLAAHGTTHDTRRNQTVSTFRIGDVIEVCTAARFDAREQRATKKAGAA